MKYTTILDRVIYPGSAELSDVFVSGDTVLVLSPDLAYDEGYELSFSLVVGGTTDEGDQFIKVIELQDSILDTGRLMLIPIEVASLNKQIVILTTYEVRLKILVFSSRLAEKIDSILSKLEEISDQTDDAEPGIVDILETASSVLQIVSPLATALLPAGSAIPAILGFVQIIPAIASSIGVPGLPPGTPPALPP